MACGFLSDHRCELWVLFIPSRVKLASSVNSTSGINRQLAIIHRHKSNRLASSPSSRRCTICRWKGYRSCWRKVRHTLVCGTLIRVEIPRVLVVGLRSTDWRMLFTSSTFCSLARSEEIWLLGGSAPVSRSLLETLTNTLEFGTLRLGNRRLYPLHAARAYNYKTRKQIPYRHILHV